MALTLNLNGQRSTPSAGASRNRKLIFTLLILLTLFLVGTVAVLSSVSYFLAIPQWAYLTELEVPWQPRDVIEPLSDVAIEVGDGLSRRQDWSEILDEIKAEEELEQAEEAAVGDGGVPGVMGTDSIPEVWDQLEDVSMTSAPISTPTSYENDFDYGAAPSGAGALGHDTYLDDTYVDDDGEGEGYGEEVGTDEPQPWDETETETEWGIDGPGSGGYWMRAGWDGRVQGVEDWQRLYNVSTRQGETMPRLIHQTWKNDVLPEKWRKAWKECREGMPDYEYMLWTDELSREFVAKHYPSQLAMYDSYKYPIQRADSIRYFILDHFGGIYMDLDIGCRRRLDPLLQGDWEVILPITKPVGVSNDLIFSSKGSAFMRDTVNGLASFNHEYITNYPTVMFSTGPMFLSAQYALYSAKHRLTTSTTPRAHVRILPKSLYGKNAPQETVPHSFFSHFYGSSWHADDAGFITFLGTWGKNLMYLGGVVLVLGALRLVYLRSTKPAYQLLPTSANSEGPVTPSTASSLGGTPQAPFRSLSPSFEPSSPTDMLRQAGSRLFSAPASLLRSSGRRRGWLSFLPSFQPTQQRRRPRTASEASQLPHRRSRRDRSSNDYPSPPPYAGESHDMMPILTVTDADGEVAYDARRGKNNDGMDEVDAFLKDNSAIEVGVASATESSEGSDEVEPLDNDEEKDDWEWKE